MKKLIIRIGIVVSIFLIIWAVFEIERSDYYDYHGYVIEVGSDEDGNTTIVALSGNTESSFIVKWYTKKSGPKKVEVAVGDRILLSTTHNSDMNIKKMKIEPGYSTEGRLIYLEGLISPFILSTQKETGARYLVSIVGHDITMLDDLDTGDIVKVYHMTPISISTVTVLYEALTKVADDGTSDLTTDDIAFVEAQGYKVRGNVE